MVKLEVGKLFQEEKTRYQEGCKFDINDSGMNVFILFSNPTTDEIKDIKEGQFKFGYYMEDNVLLMLFKFGGQQWIDAPYSVHLSKKLTSLQEISEHTGYALNIYLIDADTGILKVIRQIGLDTKSSIMLREDIIKQKEMSYEGFDTKLNNIYMKYSTNMLVSIGKSLYIKK